MIILIILIILVLLSFNLFRNLFKNNTTILDDVKLKEEDTNNNGFALMLETENADGTTSYVESSSSTWPTDMVFNSENSGCVDVNGNIIENALEYDSINNIMNVSVGETAYCYVYFDIKRYCNKNEPLGECLLRKNSEIDNLNDNIEGGLYRYHGTDEVVTDNYICFGTSDKDTCINNTDKYMYRIIGIDENGQMKIMKKTSIGDYMWHSDKTTDTSWPESDLYKGLNGIDGGSYTDLFVNSSTYTYMEKDSNWYNKIATTTWKYGDITDTAKTASELYVVENAWENTVNAKIGLIYVHDYYYAPQSGGLNCYSQGVTCKGGWMFIVGDGNNYERTMSRYGTLSKSSYKAWVVFYEGDMFSPLLTGTYGVRPVFFLASDVERSSGTGVFDDPFIITY